MKAAVYLGPGRIEIQELETPEITADEVLVKVHACAVCGTDARIYYHGQKNVVPPAVLGHEIAGTISAIGGNVKGYREGQRVTSVTSVGCGTCEYCRKGFFNMCDASRHIGYYFPGGFAEYVKVPADAVKGNNILLVPDRLDFPEIAMIEPLSCCVNGQGYLDIQAGEAVAVVGAGPIGCMHAELARAKGAAKVILFDVSPARLELAGRFAGVTIVDSSKNDPVRTTLDLTEGRGADVVIIACGVNRAQEQSVHMAAKKGRISFFAGLPKDDPVINLDANALHYKELGVFGAFASYRKQFEEALGFIASGKVEAKKFVTHKFPLERIVEGIETTKSGKGLKSVIEPQPEATGGA